MSKICWSVFGRRFPCCKPALPALEIHIVKEWDLSDPDLLATTFDVGNKRTAQVLFKNTL